jgi:hypothetical protein
MERDARTYTLEQPNAMIDISDRLPGSALSSPLRNQLNCTCELSRAGAGVAGA